MSFATGTDRCTVLQLRVVPNAKRTQIDGVLGAQLKIRLHAPPVDGKANRELISFISKTLGVRKSACTITHGEACRDKTIQIQGISVEQSRHSLLQS